MEFEQRKEILEALEYIDEVIECVDSDQTVRKTLNKYGDSIDIFANGGDRFNEDSIPEVEACEENGIKMEFGVGGKKTESSSALVDKFLSNKE